MRKFGLYAVVLATCFSGALIRPTAADAAYLFTITIQQNGSDVDVTGTGSIDLSGLIGPLRSQGIYPLIQANDGLLGLGLPGNTEVDVYQDYTGGALSVLSPSGLYAAASSGSGPVIFAAGPEVLIDASYVSGTSISDSSIYSDNTLANLGILAGTDTLNYSDGSIVIDAEAGASGPAAAPEPAGIAVLGLPLALLLLAGRRRTWAAGA